MENISSSGDSDAKIKETIWNSMLDAELETKYWGELCRIYYKWDRWIKIFLAVMSSSTVATWGIWNKIDLVWQILSGISAVTAIAIPILDLPKTLQSVLRLSSKWLQIQSQYEALWFDIENGLKYFEEVVEQYRHIKEKELLEQAPAYLPSNKKKLKERCFNQILQSRGLLTKSEGGETNG